MPPSSCTTSVARGDASGPHPIDHREQRLTPRRDADAIAAAQCGVEVGGRSRADRRRCLALVGIGIDVDDDRLGEPEPRLELLLELGVHARCDGDGRADDADGCRTLEQSRHLGLRDVEREGDVGLARAALVVHPRDLRHQPQLTVQRRCVAGTRHVASDRGHGLRPREQVYSCARERIFRVPGCKRPSSRCRTCRAASRTVRPTAAPRTA